MTFKLYILSIILSIIAPHIMPKCRQSSDEEKGEDNRSYTPGSYFENTLNLTAPSKGSNPGD